MKIDKEKVHRRCQPSDKIQRKVNRLKERNIFVQALGKREVIIEWDQCKETESKRKAPAVTSVRMVKPFSKIL